LYYILQHRFIEVTANGIGLVYWGIVRDHTLPPDAAKCRSEPSGKYQLGS
jgi:hypothetical protein